MKYINNFIFVFFGLAFPLMLSAQKGTIRGVVTDKSAGETLIGASVAVSGGGGAITDLDGQFQINIDPGTYTLTISYSGYGSNSITDVAVVADSVIVIDVYMEPSALQIAETVITASKIDNTENAILALQKRATTIQDGISSQEISRFSSNDAADAMKRVTGASVVDGKYVVVRGLGDRYSSTQLNGLPLPSTDPYRNSTQLDLIPANLMDNVIASKTFTPNLPGNFTGGNVDIKLKNFPDRYALSVTLTSSFNDQSAFNDRFLTYNGGKTDWLGYDDGTRALPGEVTDPAVRSELKPSLAISARKDAELANLLDRTVKSMSNEFDTEPETSLFNHGIAFSVGNQYNVGKNKLGVLLSGNYSRRFEHYDNGRFDNWLLLDPNSPSLALDRELTDTRSVEIPQLGGLAVVSYKFGTSNKISFNTIYNHDAEKDARYLVGPFPAILSSGIFESRSLQFKEREIQNYQLTGEHVFGKQNIRFDWSGGYAITSQVEPDLRFFADNFTINAADGDTSYFLKPSEFPLPFHFFRNLEDNQWIGKFDFTIPFLQDKSTANKIEFGALYQTKDRSFVEDRFQYQRANSANFAGDPNAFFDDSNRGILDFNEATGNYTFGLFITDVTLPVNTYTGTENITAGYGMVTYDLNRLKIIAGARLEQTDIEVISADTTKMIGSIDQLDVLPSVNLIYKLNEQMNLRAAYSNTLARPNMRELAPFSSFEFIGGFLYTGNPNLSRTRVQNYDLRWEWFPRAGEVVAVSTYYKSFKDPIVSVFVPEAPNKDEIKFENVSEAIVYGAEFEFRKSLGFITDFLSDFRLVSNFSIIQSEVAIPEGELDNIEQLNPEKGDTRPFQGQSPFLLNAALVYTNTSIGLDGGLALNVFGRRLDAASFGGTPDVYEEARPQLDFTMQKTFGKHFGIKVNLLNLLDPKFRTTREYKGEKYTIQSYERGRTFGLALTYKI